jgi:ribosomal protein L12E/L44/L45/RPP1/RPP2
MSLASEARAEEQRASEQARKAYEEEEEEEEEMTDAGVFLERLGYTMYYCDDPLLN